MTKRKPGDMSLGSWVDRQIDAAQKKGEFDNLPGEGKPLPGVDGRYDADWWIKDKIKRENLQVTPPTIEARRKVEDWLEGYLALPSAAAVRRQAQDLNEEINTANKTDLGPLLPQALLDVEKLCAQWTRAAMEEEP